MTGRRPPPLAASLLLFILASGCDSKPQEDAKAPSAPPVVAVETERLARQDISSFLKGTATIEAPTSVDVYSKTNGSVRSVAVEEGDAVAAGAILAQIDDAEPALALEKARIQRDRLKADLQRSEDLRKASPPLISLEAYEKTKYDVRQSEVECDIAALALEHTRITAPIAGVVTARSIKPGELLGANAKVFSIVDLDHLECLLHVPEGDLRWLRAGQSAIVRADPLPGCSFPARVRLINPTVTAASGTVKVTLAVENRGAPEAQAPVPTASDPPSDPPPRLIPGMFVRVAVVTETHPSALLVPKRAVVYEDNRPVLFLVKDGKALKVYPVLGFSDRDTIEAISGVGEGDEIIVVGQGGLKDQTRVAPVKR